MHSSTKLYLIRHGQTKWNVEGRRQGHGDSPLTSTGIEQAKSVGMGLQRLGVFNKDYRIITSPLGRTKATTDLICQSANIHNHQFETEVNLMEADHGIWEGMTTHEIEAKYPGQIDARLANHWDYVVPGGESYQDISVRVDNWLNSIDDGSVVIAITHDMVSRVIRKQYVGMSVCDCLKLKHHQSDFYILSNGECVQHHAIPR